MKHTYQVIVRGDNEMEVGPEILPPNDTKTNKLIQLLNHPWRLIKQGGALGVKGAKRFFTVLFLFGATNTLLSIYAINRLVVTGFIFSKLLVVLLVFAIGTGITINALYRTYQYVVIDTMSVIYGNISPVFQKISTQIVDKAEGLFQGKVAMAGNQLTKVLDFGKMVHSRYQKIPKILRKGVVLILNRIPFASMLTDLRDDISKGDKVQASTKLYHKMNGFITESIFGNNNTQWLWWLLPLNILVLLLLIRLKIG